MNERGLWELFFATGLPEVYLTLAAQRTEPLPQREELAKTAFQPRIEQV